VTKAPARKRVAGPGGPATKMSMDDRIAQFVEDERREHEGGIQARAKSELYRLAEQIQAGVLTEDADDRLMIAVILRSVADDFKFLPPKKRGPGNPAFKRKAGGDDPFGIALVIHERRANGQAYVDIVADIAEKFGTDDSAAYKLYRKHLPSCIAYFRVHGMKQPDPIDPGIAPRRKRS
jgi:hypothetical protein